MDRYNLEKRITPYISLIKRESKKFKPLKRSLVINTVYSIISIDLKKETTLYGEYTNTTQTEWEKDIRENRIKYKTNSHEKFAFTYLSLPGILPEVNKEIKNHISDNNKVFTDPLKDVVLFSNSKNSCYCDSVLAIMCVGTAYFWQMCSYKVQVLKEKGDAIYGISSNRDVSIDTISENYNTIIGEIFPNNGSTYLSCRESEPFDILTKIISKVRSKSKSDRVDSSEIYKLRDTLLKKCNIGEGGYRQQDSSELYYKLVQSIMELGAISTIWFVRKSFEHSKNGPNFIRDTNMNYYQVHRLEFFCSDIPKLYIMSDRVTVSGLLRSNFPRNETYFKPVEDQPMYVYNEIIYIPKVFAFMVVYEVNLTGTGVGLGVKSRELAFDIENDEYTLFKRYPDREDVKIHLFGFITHIGETGSGGHYTCHIKINNKWYYYNDSSSDRLKLIGNSLTSYVREGKITTLFFYCDNERE